MKKRTIMVVAVLTAVSLLAYLAFAGTTEKTGYETFKDVIRNHESIEVESGEVSGSITITDNGEEVISLEGNIAGNHNTKEMSGQLKIITDSLEKELSVYGFEDFVYILDQENNDVYVAKNDEEMNDERYESKHKSSDEFSEKSEAILDIIVGDLANQFETVKDTDGTTDVSFELTKNEVPAILNLLTSMPNHGDYGHDSTDEHSDMDLEAYPLFNEFCNLDVELTELVENVELEYLKITLDLDATQQVKGVEVSVEIKGLDENGKTHVMAIDATFNITSLGNATIEKIDLDDKNVYELPEGQDHMRKHNR